MTGLCTIPGCRIRNRHLPGCADDGCRDCLPRSTTDGLVCDVCTGSAGGRLAEIIQLTPDLCLVAYGLVQRGSDGGGNSKPGSRSPGNDDALDTLHEVNNRLTTMAREIADAQHLQEPAAGLGVSESLGTAAKWLSGQMAWLRGAVDDQGGPYAAVVFAEIADCASKMRWLINGPTGDQRYLGPCGAPQIAVDLDVAAEYGIHPANAALGLAPCDGDVYVRGDARIGRCKTCGAEVDRGDREAWLSGEVRGWAFRASEIAEAYRVNVDTIRSWAFRGRLKSYWRTDADLTVEWVDPVVDPKLKGDELAEREAEVAAEVKARGLRLHYVGDVLDLAAADAARRETNRAERARRTAARETAEMGA